MLRKNCPCDVDGICPYDAEYNSTCEYYCSDEEPSDDCDYDTGYDPYLGCFTDDC